MRSWLTKDVVNIWEQSLVQAVHNSQHHRAELQCCEGPFLCRFAAWRGLRDVSCQFPLLVPRVERHRHRLEDRGAGLRAPCQNSNPKGHCRSTEKIWSPIRCILRHTKCQWAEKSRETVLVEWWTFFTNKELGIHLSAKYFVCAMGMLFCCCWNSYNECSSTAFWLGWD